LNKKQKKKSILIFSLIFVILVVGIILVPGLEKEETLQEVMTDAVLHESGQIDLFGIATVNPALVSAFIVSAILILAAILIRIFVIPKFTDVPGKFQMLLEQAVGLFDGMAKDNSPHRNKIMGGYIFCAGVYIFVGTIFELFGFQAVTTHGIPIALPAPLADINGAIAMGVLSYSFLLIGGIIGGGLHGLLNAVKEFSLPISMSFRLFGALLSGALVTELVYYSAKLSFVVPVFVGFMFTLLHALIQAYVLTTLVSIFYGECTEPHEKKTKKDKKSRQRKHLQPQNDTEAA